MRVNKRKFLLTFPKSQFNSLLIQWTLVVIIALGSSSSLAKVHNLREGLFQCGFSVLLEDVEVSPPNDLFSPGEAVFRLYISSEYDKYGKPILIEMGRIDNILGSPTDRLIHLTPEKLSTVFENHPLDFDLFGNIKVWVAFLEDDQFFDDLITQRILIDDPKQFKKQTFEISDVDQYGRHHTWAEVRLIPQCQSRKNMFD